MESKSRRARADHSSRGLAFLPATFRALLVERRKDLPRREHAPGIEIGNAFVDSLQKPLFVVELIGERGSDQNARRNAGFPRHAFEPLCQIPRNAYLVVHHRTALIVSFIVHPEGGKSKARYGLVRKWH